MQTRQLCYTCGADLDLDGFSALHGHCRPFVRLKMDCASHVELQYYSSGIVPQAVSSTTCGFCGEEGTLRDEGRGESAHLLPVCDLCQEQHGKTRSSRARQAPRFDRSGKRAKRAALAQRREEEMRSARERSAAQIAARDEAEDAASGARVSACTDTSIPADPPIHTTRNMRTSRASTNSTSSNANAAQDV